MAARLPEDAGGTATRRPQPGQEDARREASEEGDGQEGTREEVDRGGRTCNEASPGQAPTEEARDLTAT